MGEHHNGITPQCAAVQRIDKLTWNAHLCTVVMITGNLPNNVCRPIISIGIIWLEIL